MTAQTNIKQRSVLSRRGDPAPCEYPVREYIGAMAVELAQMARWDGDEDLGRLLDAAVARAGEPAPVLVVALGSSGQRRSS
ncbi:hypothetical protein [Brevundimonas sp.]|uniref:hypothetical protein n=1 Tax=Brevundimonas sp. TaxID=1871086 RepID=UPI00391B8B0E